MACGISSFGAGLMATPAADGLWLHPGLRFFPAVIATIVLSWLHFTLTARVNAEILALRRRCGRCCHESKLILPSTMRFA